MKTVYVFSASCLASIFLLTSAYADSADKKFLPFLPEISKGTTVSPCAGKTLNDVSLAGQKHDGVRFNFNPGSMQYDATREVWYDNQGGSTYTCQLNSNADSLGDDADLVYDFRYQRYGGAHYHEWEKRVAYGDTMMDSLENANGNDERGSNSCFICGLVRFKKGCFPPGVKVTLGDGHSTKAVEDVASGDLLWNPVLKKAVKVLNVIEGPEEKPLVMVNAGSFSLKMSQEHPVWTKAGLKQAKALSLGDVLFDASGKEVAISELSQQPVKEAQTVINFVLEGDAGKGDASRMILADGLVVADLVAQKKLADNQ